MVEVFRTNVQEALHAKWLADVLLEHFPGSKINFDLEDCDKVLRIEGNDLVTTTVLMLINRQGFNCMVME